MTTVTQQLADALRTIDEHCQTGLNSSVYSHWSAALEDVMRVSREGLAAYDAQTAGVTNLDAFMAKWEWLTLSRCRDEFRADLAAMLATAQAASGGDSCDECQIHRQAHQSLDNIVMGAGVFEVLYEGGVEPAWKNTIEAVKKLTQQQK